MKSFDIPATGVVLFHFWPSLCSQKVRLVLAEKGVDYEGRLVNIGPPMENYEPAYVRLNPGAVIPTLVVDGEIITDSLRIMHEIDRRFAGPPLLPGPSDPALEKVERLLRLQNVFPFREHAYGTLTGFLRLATRASMKWRIRKLERMKRAAPDLADAYDRKIADVAKWNVTMRDDAEVERLDRRAEALLDELEQTLVSQEFLAGDSYTLADAAWTVIVSRLHMQGRQHWWTGGRRPRVEAWYGRMRERPSYRAATIWDRLHFGVMAPIVARVLLPPLAIILALAAAIGAAIWWSVG
jgi:glutathione S-transferase